LAAAARWIAGDAARRAGGLSLDLAVEMGGRVVGEVGLVPYAAAAGVLELGWWVTPEHRGKGVASVAARLLADWVQGELARSAVARCDPANPASCAVAANAGLHEGWSDDKGVVWVRP
jgi:RimJ/RimL family protein N-acetyltransferase